MAMRALRPCTTATRALRHGMAPPRRVSAPWRRAPSGSEADAGTGTKTAASSTGELELKKSERLTSQQWWSVVSPADASRSAPADEVVNEDSLRHIVIAVDDEPASAHAVQWAAKNLVRAGGDLVLLCHIVPFEATSVYAAVGTAANIDFAPGPDPAMATPVQRASLVEHAVKHSEETLLRLAQPLAAGKEVATECCVIIEMTFEDTAKMLAEVADDYEAECIVVGTTHKSWLQRLFLGSVSHHLVTNYSHPVVVVPVPEPDTAGEAAAAEQGSESDTEWLDDADAVAAPSDAEGAGDVSKNA